MWRWELWIMKADKYITKIIESFIEANPDAKMKYMYDTIFNMHVIEVASATLYESAEFKAWHDDLISEIARKYPTEEVGVILTDSF